MKLYFKQRFFSWFDSYDIYDYDTGDVVYTVEGQLAWGHCLHILDAGVSQIQVELRQERQHALFYCGDVPPLRVENVQAVSPGKLSFHSESRCAGRGVVNVVAVKPREKTAA